MADETKEAQAADAEEQKVEEAIKPEEKVEAQKAAEDKVAEPKETVKETVKKEAKKKEAKKVEIKKKEKVKVKKPEILRDLNYFTEVRKDLPEIKPGDVLRVSYRVIEGGKERIQVFEGTTIAIKNAGISKTITVRKTSFGIAVERIFPLNSKLVQGIEVKKHSKVRRAKLYYLRGLKGKAARLRELR